MDKLYYRHEEFIIKTTDAVYAGLLGPVEFEQAIKEYISIYLGVDMDEINKAQAVTVIDNSDFNSYMIKKPKKQVQLAYLQLHLRVQGIRWLYCILAILNLPL